MTTFNQICASAGDSRIGPYFWVIKTYFMLDNNFTYLRSNSRENFPDSREISPKAMGIIGSADMEGEGWCIGQRFAYSV
jgi:hypothetical protein